MVSLGERKSHRLNELLKMCQRQNTVTTYADLMKKCLSWGVTKNTAEGYIQSVSNLINKSK